MEKQTHCLTSCLPFILQILISFLFDSHVLFYTLKNNNIYTHLHFSVVENDNFQPNDKQYIHSKVVNAIMSVQMVLTLL